MLVEATPAAVLTAAEVITSLLAVAAVMLNGVLVALVRPEDVAVMV
jgi:hypothetical protein